MNNSILKTKVNIGNLLLFVTEIALLTLLVSELTAFLGLTQTAFVAGTKKTLLYLIFVVCALFSAMKINAPLSGIIAVFTCFTFFTCVSTVLGVTPDISLPRQCIHLLLFWSVLFVFYNETEKKGSRPQLFCLYLGLICMIALCLIARSKDTVKSANTVYYVLLFQPLVSFLRQGTLRKIIYIVLFLLVLLSNKRTALLAIGAYFVVFELVTNKSINKKSKAYRGIACILLLIVAYFLYPIVIEKLGITVFDELSDISADGGSNRLFIYEQLWSVQKKQNLIHWLIGDGYNSVLLSHICVDGSGGEWVSGHNDFLETLYDYGLIGLGLYLSFFIGLLKKGMKMLRSHYVYAGPFLASIAMVFVISLTSHLIIYLNYYAVIMAFWGICLADCKNYDKARQGGIGQ